MPFAIEALQCKSKLSNVKSREFSRTLWPELRPKEENTIVQTATCNIKNAVRAMLARVRGRSAGGGRSDRETEEHREGAENTTTDEIDNGFLEVNIVKRIRTGNKLLTAETVEHE